MSTLEKLRTVTASRDCDPILERPGLAWGRAGDLIVGVVEVDPRNAGDKINEAYDLLDESRALLPHELWSVVLVVVVAGQRADAQIMARRLERDLRRSRKIAVTESSRLPNLFAGIGGQVLPDPEMPSDVVSTALDQVAVGELREALEVLLKGKRASEEVERLIALLELESEHA